VRLELPAESGELQFGGDRIGELAQEGGLAVGPLPGLPGVGDECPDGRAVEDHQRDADQRTDATVGDRGQAGEAGLAAGIGHDDRLGPEIEDDGAQ
jgi:hypothetical protein